jgi:hypothetical protein
MFESNSMIFIISTIVSVISLMVSSFILPKVMTVSEFGQWRSIITILSYAGITHIGIADGLLIHWSRTRLMKIPTNIVLPTLLINTLLALFVASIGVFAKLFPPNIFFTVSIGIFSMSMQSFAIHFIQIFLKGKYFLLGSILQPLGLFVGISFLYFLEALHPESILVVFIFSNLLSSLFVFSNFKIFSLSKSIKIKDIIFSPNNGLYIMLGNFAFLGFLNFDKIILRNQISDQTFGNYALLSILISASVAISAPLGNIVLSRELFMESKFRYFVFVVGTFLSAACLVFNQEMQSIVSLVFVNYDTDKLLYFLISSIFFSIYTSVCLPAEKYMYGRFFIFFNLSNFFVFLLSLVFLVQICDIVSSSATSMLFTSVVMVIRSEYFINLKLRKLRGRAA